MLEKKTDHDFPDRPLDCGECKKTIAVRYTEIIGHAFTQTSMCADCPELQLRLHGTKPCDLIANQTDTIAALACGNCGTSLEEVKRGNLLGCSECYTVFEDLLLIEFQGDRGVPSRLLPIKKNVPIHLGRCPGEKLTISPSSRLLALNDALKETLSREDYEQAALLRDQIKALTEHEKRES
ncbi:MAG: UvrB/UvrC motif-containing protein [Parachlamydiaceae bacterium]